MNRRLLYVAAGLAVALIAARRAAVAAQVAVDAAPAEPGAQEPGAQEPGAQEPGAHDTGGSVAVEAGPVGQLRTFLDDVRTYAAEREAELREALGLDGSHDVVDAAL